MKTKTLRIQGMHGLKDRERALSALHDVWGVREVDINHTTGDVIISFDETAGSIEDFEQALIDEGFEVGGYHEDL